MAAAFPVEAWLGVPGDAQQLAAAPSAIAQRFPPQAQRAAWAAVQAAAAAAGHGAPGAGSSGGAVVPRPAAPGLSQSPGSGAPAASAASPSPASGEAPAALGMVRQLSQHRFFIPISTPNAAALSALLSASCQRLHPQESTDQWDLALHCLLLLAAWARKLWAAPGPLRGTPAAATQQAPAPQAVASGRRVPAASSASQDSVGGPGARQAPAVGPADTAMPAAASASCQDGPNQGQKPSCQDGPNQGQKPAPPRPGSQQRQSQLSQGDSIAARASQGALKLCSMATLAGAAAAGVAGRAGWTESPAAAATADAGASPTADADRAAGSASPEAVAGAAVYCLGCFLSSRGLGSPGKEAAADALLHSLARLRGLWGLPGQSQADGEGGQALQGTLGGGERIPIEQDRGLHRAMAGTVYALCSSAALAEDSQAGGILVRVLGLFCPSPGPSPPPRPPQAACMAPEEAVQGTYAIPPLPECHGDKRRPRGLVLQRAIQQETDVCFAQGRLVLRALEYVGAYWHSSGVPAPGAVQALVKASTPVPAVESATAALSQALLAPPSSPPGTSSAGQLRRGVHPWCAAVFAAAGLLRGLCGSASRSKSSATGKEEPAAGAGAGRQAAAGAPDTRAGEAGGVGTDRVATESATSPLWSETLGSLLGPAVARLAECLVAAAEASCPWAPACSLPTSLPPQLPPAAPSPLQQDSAVLLKPGWLDEAELVWLARHFPGENPGFCWPALALEGTGNKLLASEGEGRGSSSPSGERLAGALVCLRCAAVALSELAGGGGPGLWRVRGSQGAGSCLAAALLSDCLSLVPLRRGDALVAALAKEEAGDAEGRPLGRCPPAPGNPPTPSPQAKPPSSASAVHAQGAWFRSAPLLTRALVEHAKAAPPGEQAWLSQTLLAFATSAHQGERSALGVLHACQSTSCAPTQGQQGPSVRQAGHAGALPSPPQGSSSLVPSTDPSPAGQRPQDASADTISGTAYTVICLLFTALAQGSPGGVSQPSASWPHADPAAVHQAVALDALASLALLDFAKVGLGSLFVSLVASCSVLVSSSTPMALALLGRLPPYQDVVGAPLPYQSASGCPLPPWQLAGPGLAGEGARDGSASGESTAGEAGAPWKAAAMLGPGTGGGVCVDWTQDAPTTARVVFLFRILLPAMPLLPVPSFCTAAGPLLLLYLGHTNSKAAVQASHDLFVALLTTHSQADSIASPQSRRNLQAYCTDLRAPLLPARPRRVDSATGDGMPCAEGRATSAPGGLPRMQWGPKGDLWVAFAAQPVVQAREQRAVPPVEMLEAVSILYAARALQAVPGVTPLALLGRGLAAICRNLAAASPAVEVCVDLLTERAGALLQEASGPDCHTSGVPTQQPLPATSRTGPATRAPGEKHSANKSAETLAAAEAAGPGSAAWLSGSTGELSGDGGKSLGLPVAELRQLLLLLLHLVPVVDIQVLPHLLRRIAARITSLNHFPDTNSFSGRQLQREALGELLQVILGSDDYTRKPTLISFYQSLALVSCRQVTSKL